MNNSKELQKEVKRRARVELSKRHLLDFTDNTFNNFDWTTFHKTYYEILNRFAWGEIKKLIITVPPQHGKSEGSTRRLPSFLLGINPDLRIAIASYSDTFAKKFNRDCQRIIDSKEYNEIFPNTILNQSNVVTISDNYLRNSSEFEIVDKLGSLKAIGKGGALTGNPVDIMIMDDLYKDYMEGNSPTIRENVWDWYASVVKTRLHNDSQELIVFTRWHEDDLIGRLEKKEEVIDVNCWDDLKNINRNAWVKLNFEAIKTTDYSEIDPRNSETALYPKKHSLERLQDTKALDEEKFSCLYQGDPQSAAGMLYKPFETYNTLPPMRIIKNYTDTADKGVDYSCSIVYGIGLEDNQYYIIDIVYTDESMDVTENLIINLLNYNKVNEADFESNNGGRFFAKKVGEKVYSGCKINWFHQSDNKEARIISNSATVNQKIMLPLGWNSKWSTFYDHLVGFKKLFKANKQDGIPDVITGIIEKNNNYNDYEIRW